MVQRKKIKLPQPKITMTKKSTGQTSSKLHQAAMDILKKRAQAA